MQVFKCTPHCATRGLRRVFFSTTPDRSDTLKAVSTTMQSPDVAASEPVVKRYPDMDTLSRQVAADIAARLTHAIATRGLASLVVSGGRSPVKLFEQLRTQTIDWSRVCVALADERWVAPTDADSNEKLVREALLQGNAAAARFLGLKNAAPSPDLGAVSAWETFARIPRPFDVTLLGMGDDGHTASLFPGSPNLRSALNPAAAAGLSALRRLGEPGNNEAVCPSSPMPSSVTSNGRGMRAKVSQADTAPKSGEGAAFLSPRKRAAAALPCSNASRTSFSLLSASVGATQRSSASATQTRLHSIV